MLVGHESECSKIKNDGEKKRAKIFLGAKWVNISLRVLFKISVCTADAPILFLSLSNQSSLHTQY